MGKRKRAKALIHTKNKYAQDQPDFSLLASLYPSFEPFVFSSRDGKCGIDWTDYNATRELTRVLLLHDHSINWWIPDGQLCPAVPNRSNYIHWIADLLSCSIFHNDTTKDLDFVRGFDIGTGANCIYPLLGASIYGWSFVGSDAAEVALEWASKNVDDNPHISKLIEIRRAVQPSSCNSVGAPVLLSVVKEDEKFDFCMCNPPFFSSMEEAGLNPKTCYGGTPEEMVCPGGEFAFVNKIIEDSMVLRESFRWYTSMIGKKKNIRLLTSKLWKLGASVVKTTEFAQGQTSRWGIAWSFLPTLKKLPSLQSHQNSKFSFILEGVVDGSAVDTLNAVQMFFQRKGASCLLNTSDFSAIVEIAEENMCIRISVFQQTRGTLLVQGSSRDSCASGNLASIAHQLEETLKVKFCPR